MTQFYSRNDVNYSGDVYSIPFDYIDKKEIKVYIDDELWTKWHFLSEHQLTLDEVPEDIRYSNIISVRRETNIEDKVVTYDNNSLLNKENLNKSQEQLLYAVQEIYDNNTQFAIDIREEVDYKVERVSEAVEKLEAIDDSVQAANNAAQAANDKAVEAEETLIEIGKVLEEAEAEADRAAEYVETIEETIDQVKTKVALAIFDTITKDHVLTYEESKGLALQGTYVYKDAIAGSRYGYPDFYNTVIEEYNNSPTKDFWTKANITPVGTLVDNQGVLSGFSTTSWALLPDYFSPDGFNWEMMFKFTTGTIGTKQDILNTQNKAYQTISIYIDKTGKLVLAGYNNDTSTAIINVTGTTILTANTTYYVKVSYNNIEGYKLELRTEDTDFVIEISAAVVTPINNGGLPALGVDFKANGLYNEGAFTGSIDVKESYIKLDGQNWWIGCEHIEYKQDVKGHKLYNINIKDKIDRLFESTGNAWFYGVDTENERIFLPRIKERKLIERKEPTQADPRWYNLYSDGWLEQGGFHRAPATLITVTLLKEYKDTAYHITSAASYVSNTTIYSPTVGVTTKTPSSFSVYQNSTDYYCYWRTSGYAETPVEEKSLYICVGNTQSTGAITDVIDVTTTENDTIPLFTGMYFDFTPNNLSWLKGGRTASGLKEYKFTYNTLVNILNGDTKYGNLKVINHSDMLSGFNYSEYWIVNQDKITFTTPLVAGLAHQLQDKGRILIEKKEPTENDNTWYNLYSDGWIEQGGVLVTGDNWVISFPKAFRDSNYTLIGERYGQDSIANLGVVTQTPTNASGNHYSNSNMTTAWRASGYTEIPLISDYTENVSVYFKVANAVQNLELLDVGQVMENAVLRSSLTEAQVVIETYVNGTSWYRVWSDGWCEQGGQTAAGTSITVTLLKPFKNLNYNVSLTCVNKTASDQNWTCSSKTANAFVYSNSESFSADWRACGYIH